jgi:hypothetical protein
MLVLTTPRRAGTLMAQNDTYGEITATELADLRLHALRCRTCGMLGTVDPAFHASRYGHAPKVDHGPNGAAFRWDVAGHRWVQTS